MSERRHSIERFCFSWILENGHLQLRRSFSETLFKVLNLFKSGRLGSRLGWSENIWKTKLMGKNSRKRISAFGQNACVFLLTLISGLVWTEKNFMQIFQISPFYAIYLT